MLELNRDTLFNVWMVNMGCQVFDTNGCSISNISILLQQPLAATSLSFRTISQALSDQMLWSEFRYYCFPKSTGNYFTFTGRARMGTTLLLSTIRAIITWTVSIRTVTLHYTDASGVNAYYSGKTQPDPCVLTHHWSVYPAVQCKLL